VIAALTLELRLRLGTMPRVLALYRCLMLAVLPGILAGCASSNSVTRARMLTPVALPPHAATVPPAPLISAPPASVPQTPPPAALPPDSAHSLTLAGDSAPPAQLPLEIPKHLETPEPGTVSLPAPNGVFGLPRLLSGKPWPETWFNVWVPFETWTEMNHLASPVQLTPGTQAVFTAGSAGGLIRLKIGSQQVSLLGHDYLIGFPPRIVGGVPYLHSLDLQKTLQPLLTGTLELPRTNRVIVIDAGHGGRDSGTRNTFGPEHEKAFTLDWARRLESILSSNGWTVVLTRSNDVEMSLTERVAVAERARADLFLSLHFNAGAQHSAMNGLETFCLTPVGLPSTLRRDFDDNPRDVYPNNAHDQANFLLASRLHRSLLKTTGATDRGVRRARFMTVLRGQNRPAVLLEGGYLSNPTESRRIATPAYRQLLAEAVAQALDGSAVHPAAGNPSTASAFSGTADAAARP